MVVLKKDYSHCPLKKRPFSACYDESGEEQTEPQDLSLKCAKEAPAIHTQEPYLNVYTQEAQMQNIDPGTPSTSSVAANLCQRISNLRAEDIQTKSIYRKESCTQNIQNEAPLNVSHGIEFSDQKQYTQVICHVESISQTTKEYVPCISPLSDVPTSSQCESASEEYLCLKHNFRIKSLHNHIVNSIEKRRLKSEGNETHLAAATTIIRSPGSSTHSQSNYPPRLTVGNDRSPLCVPPPSNLVHPPIVSSGMVQCPKTVTKCQRTTTSPAAPISIPNTNSSSNVSTPHRPWLAEGPPRPLPRPFPETGRMAIGQTPHPRSLLVGPPHLWTGMVPFTWTVPPILANSRPPTPRRHQSRECCSPGSESASSDGSSGSLRNDTRYSCTECSKSYSTYSGLSKHKQFHCVALGAKSFACKHCEKVYTSLGALKMHIRTHTLPCKCPLCGKAFSRPWLLQGHIRTHTGEKPFQCPQCDRCFADRSNLRAHLQTHADIKKYACNTCHKTFSRMSLLNKHSEAACPAMHKRSLQ